MGAMQNLPSRVQLMPFKAQLGYMANTAFFRIAEDWGLDIDDQCKLMGFGLIDVEKFRRDPAVPQNRNQLIRIRCLVMLYKHFRHKHGSLEKVCAFIRSPEKNAPFFGSSPIRHMLKTGVVGIAATTKYFTGALPELNSVPEDFRTD